MRLRLLLLLLGISLAACTTPANAPVAATTEVVAPVGQPDHCRGDGTAPTWLLWPIDPPTSDLMTAYQQRQVIEFNAVVSGVIDEFARLPHRAFVLSERAEGVTVALDYQGDPPPLIVGQTYRLVAWAYPRAGEPPEPGQPITVTNAPGLERWLPLALPGRAVLENYQSYELQIFDDLGLLFLGATDVSLEDDPLDLHLSDGMGDCSPVAAPQNACVQSRQVLPLVIRWGDDELTLYPGDDGQLAHQGMVYTVSVFRNRQVQEVDPPCPDYYEHRRSVRIERVQPPPLVPALPPVTATITATLTITAPQP